MAVEVEPVEPPPGAVRAVPGPSARRHPRWRLDRFELAVLVAFAALSMWVVALDLFQVVEHGRHWTGTDGVFIDDQLQYLAWIRSASQHLLVSNLFVLRHTPADYFQPAIVISGALTALGVAPWLSLLLWKPVAVGACFFAVRAYVARSMSDRWARRAALVLALFFGSFTVIYGTVGTIGDIFPGFLSWGYMFGLVGIAAMAAALLAHQRALVRGRIAWGPGLLGALASSMHPWNGELVILIVLGAELVMNARRRPLRAWVAQPALTVALTAAPLAYYWLLARFDESWRLASHATKHSFPLWSIGLELLPLVLCALPAYRGRPRDFLSAATRVWPPAALALFMLSSTQLSGSPLHAFQGITLPLAVLAVEGVRRIGFGRLRHRFVWATLGIALFTIPAVVDQANGARKLVAPQPGNPTFIAPGESRALAYLAADPQPGGVISRSYLSALVPGETGRHTFNGDCIWSEPNCVGRETVGHRLFDGALTPTAARTFVLTNRARFLLADCRTTANLEQLLGPVIESVHRFGCAAVYEVR
jgi:hypothetical protein